MAFDVSGLDSYKDESSLELLTAKTLGTKTAAMCKPVPKVKSSFELHLLANTPANQVGGTCGFNASGTTTLTSRLLTTSPIKWNMEFCLKALEAKYTQQFLKAGQDQENQSVPQAIVANIIDEITDSMEVNDWTGTIAGTAKYDGLHTLFESLSLTQANSASYTPSGAVISSQPTASTINQVVYGLYRCALANNPAVLDGNPVIVLPTEWFGLLEEYYLDKNYFSWSNATTASGDSSMLPLLGHSNVKIMHTRGLSGEQTAYLVDFSRNVYIGFDSEGEEYVPKLWYSKDDDVYRLKIEARRGFQVAYPSEIFRFNIPAS